MVVNGNFNIDKVYCLMKEDHVRVPWRRIIRDNKASPKSVFIGFILWLTAHQRLATTDRLLKWNINCNPICSLCKVKYESIEHLFFQCSYAAIIWSNLLRILHSNRRCKGFACELRHACKQAHNKSKRARLYVMLFTEAVYAIWAHRNSKTFQNSHFKPSQVIKEVIFRVAARYKDEDGSMIFVQVLVFQFVVFLPSLACCWLRCGFPLACIDLSPIFFGFSIITLSCQKKKKSSHVKIVSLSCIHLIMRALSIIQICFKPPKKIFGSTILVSLILFL